VLRQLHVSRQKYREEQDNKEQHIRENKERWRGKKMYKKFPCIFEENLSKINSEIDA
jgi:hypothetical protein